MSEPSSLPIVHAGCDKAEIKDLSDKGEPSDEPSMDVGTPTSSILSASFPVFLDFLPCVQFQNLVNFDDGAASPEIHRQPNYLGETHQSDPQSNASSQLSAMFDGLQLKSPMLESRAFVPDGLLTDEAHNSQIMSSKDRPTPATQFLALAVFMMSNQLSEMDSQAGQKIYRWIRRRASARLFEYLLSQGGPSMEALAENLMILSIEKDDPRMLQSIIRGGLGLLNPEKLRCVGEYGDTVTLLQRACEWRNPKLIKLLLKAGVDVNYSPRRFASPLCVLLSAMDEYCEYIAVDIHLVKLLVKAGANVNPPGESPLYFAASTCQVDVVTYLLSKNADPNFQGDCGTPLTAALQSDAPASDVLQVTRRLLESGASVRNLVYAFDEYASVLEDAVSFGNPELIDVLLEAGAPMTEETLNVALCIGNSTMIRHLVSSGAILSERTAAQAAPKVDPALFEFLVQHVAESSRSSFRSIGLIEAINHGNQPLSNALIELSTPFAGPKMKAALSAAAHRGEIALFDKLLASEKYRTAIMYDLESALCGSIKGGHDDLTILLLDSGADVNSNSYGSDTTPLLEAVRQMNIEITRRLLALGAAVNMTITREDKPNIRSSALPPAVEWGFLPLIQDLINLGADLNAQDSQNNKTALAIAIKKGDRRSIRLLLLGGADVNQTYEDNGGETPLSLAISAGDLPTVRQLLEMGAYPNEAALIAASSKSRAMVEMVFKCKMARHQLFIQGYGSRALQVAITSSNAAIVEVLLENGVDSNFIVSDAKYMGLRKRSLLEPSENESALGTAVRLKSKGFVKLLLDYGASPNQVVVEDGRRTALIVATENKDRGVVELLLSAGAELNQPLLSRGARTPLAKAVEVGSVELTHLFLDHGANVNAPACHLAGATALQLAAIKGFVGIASLLLSKGACIDAPGANFDGRTAIEGASEYGRIDMIKLLVDNGAQLIGSGNEQYKRARQFAANNGYAAAERLLENCRSQQLEWQELCIHGGS